MGKSKEYDLVEAIEAVASQVDSQLDIVAVKIVGASNAPIVRVYIDHPDGVTFDLLTATQKWIGDLLEEVNPFASSWTLEVSSPGPDRPLRKPEHFKAALGKKAKVSCNEAVNGRKGFSGTITSADDENIEITLDEGKKGEEPRFQIPINNIKSANLKPGKEW